MKKNLLLIIGFLFITHLTICQSPNTEVPISFINQFETNIDLYDLNVVFSKIQEKPQIDIIDNDTIVFVDPIIGELFDVSINVNNRGTWTEINNGDSIWQIQINANVGDYMMLIFDDFYLPKGSELFIYSTDRSQIYGPFTDIDNYLSRNLTAAPLKTNSLVIEYHKPSYVKEKEILNVQFVGLIDSLFTKAFSRDFGGSGNCMINALCPEYTNWCDQTRSVALIIRVLSKKKEIRWCSGALLTNEKRDGNPFFLTAFHCIDCDKNGVISQSEMEELKDWLFIFNYQSATCSNPTADPPFLYSIPGANFIRAHKNTDYALLQLRRKPPKNYNVFYNGWSNDKNDMTETGVCIHHPSGDIKKISEWKKVTSGRVNFWKVKWAKGATEPGSSGSPLFTSSAYVVGQLYGGSSSCNNDLADFYGRFHRSWHNFGLCNELNPTGIHSGSGQNWIVSMVGDETCKQNYIFNNCDDLHTSANVHYLDYYTVGKRQYDGVYNAKDFITAENTTIQPGTAVVFEAGNTITLKPGFHAVAGSNFTAKIGDCELGCNNGKKSSEDNETVIFTSNIKDAVRTDKNIVQIDNLENISEFLIYPNPNYGIFSIKLHQDITELQQIIITDVRGTVVYNNFDKNVVNNEIVLTNPSAGIYIISLHFNNKILISKFAVL